MKQKIISILLHLPPHFADEFGKYTKYALGFLASPPHTLCVLDICLFWAVKMFLATWAEITN
jgi:hypothetical protein